MKSSRGLGICLANVAFGLAAGASLVWPVGWLVLQICLVGLLQPLSTSSAKASTAAAAFSAFTAALMTASLMGFTLGLPDQARALGLISVLLAVMATAISAGLLAWVCFRLVSSPVLRVALALPSAWIVHEWLFSLSELTLPWVRLGYAQAPSGPFAGALSLGGVLLASGLVMSLSGLLAASWTAQGSSQRFRLGACAALLLACSAVGHLQWTSPAGNVTALLIQGGGSAAVGSVANDKTLATTLAEIANAARDESANLILTSELALQKTPAALPAAYLKDLHSTLNAMRSDAVLGMYFGDDDAIGFYNGALGLGVSGNQRYVKSQLFPFGEFVPLNGVLGAWADALMPQPLTRTSRAQATYEPMLLAGHRAAIAICIEAAFGETWRRRAASADFLINMTNDSAVRSMQVARQAKAIAQTRAMELQKPLLRVSDSAGTFAVTAFGAVTSEVATQTVRTGRAHVETRSGLTPYARWGDALPLTVTVLAACFLILRRNAESANESAAISAAGRSLSAGARWTRGQVLPLAVGLLVIVAAFLYLMVNSGQSVTEKIRVTNAADAAAYSAGIAEARALNYDAYLNRAMVANEIVIAQLVSFASWTNYFAQTALHYPDTSAEINFFVLPNLRVLQLDAIFLGADLASIAGGRSPVEYARDITTGLDFGVWLLNVAANGLELSQKTVQASLTAGLSQQLLANQVVRAMDPALTALVVPVSHGMGNFAKGYERNGPDGDERARLADVTLRSRDPFTRERNWEVGSFDIPLFRKDGALKKRGGTDLIGFDEWRAVDTLELHGERFGCGKWGLSWCGDIQRPIGWGAAMASRSGGDEGRGHHGNAYGENAATAARADSEIRPMGLGSFSGIPDSFDLRDLDPAREQLTGITVRVSKALASTLTSGNAAQFRTTGALDLYGNRPAGGQMAALSRAEVFYDRIAARADGKTELASLFNPYWRVRLVAPTAADKAFSAALQGGLVLP